LGGPFAALSLEVLVLNGKPAEQIVDASFERIEMSKFACRG
jgi:hypothetical protein